MRDCSVFSELASSILLWLANSFLPGIEATSSLDNDVIGLQDDNVINLLDDVCLFGGELIKSLLDDVIILFRGEDATGLCSDDDIDFFGGDVIG